MSKTMRLATPKPEYSVYKNVSGLLGVRSEEVKGQMLRRFSELEPRIEKVRNRVVEVNASDFIEVGAANSLATLKDEIKEMVENASSTKAEPSKHGTAISFVRSFVSRFLRASSIIKDDELLPSTDVPNKILEQGSKHLDELNFTLECPELATALSALDKGLMGEDFFHVEKLAEHDVKHMRKAAHDLNNSYIFYSGLKAKFADAADEKFLAIINRLRSRVWAFRSIYSLKPESFSASDANKIKAYALKVALHEIMQDAEPFKEHDGAIAINEMSKIRINNAASALENRISPNGSTPASNDSDFVGSVLSSNSGLQSSEANAVLKRKLISLLMKDSSNAKFRLPREPTPMDYKKLFEKLYNVQGFAFDLSTVKGHSAEILLPNDVLSIFSAMQVGFDFLQSTYNSFESKEANPKDALKTICKFDSMLVQTMEEKHAPKFRAFQKEEAWIAEKLQRMFIELHEAALEAQAAISAKSSKQSNALRRIVRR